jgi:hypothetical protein
MPTIIEDIRPGNGSWSVTGFDLICVKHEFSGEGILEAEYAE